MRYSDLIGQEDVIAQLKKFGEFFASKGGTPGPILLVGEEGMGKNTIADTFAGELGVELQEVDTAEVQVKGDLTAIMTNLRERQVLLLTNVQSLKRPPADLLRGALRDDRIDIIIGQGSSARRHTMDFRPFTLVATCPKKSDCPPELLTAFSLILSLQPYSRLELQALSDSIAKSLGLFLEAPAAELIARNCDGRPGHIRLLLQRLMRAINETVITGDDLRQAFSAFGVRVLDADASTVASDSFEELSGEDFEKLITVLLTRMGFQAEMTRTTGDGGIDIVAMLDKPIFGGRYLFQCKRFGPENLVGAPTVRDFFGALTADRAVKGIFVTTSDFTPQAREFGEKVGLELIDLKQLRKLLLEHGLLDGPSQ